MYTLSSKSLTERRMMQHRICNTFLSTGRTRRVDFEIRFLCIADFGCLNEDGTSDERGKQSQSSQKRVWKT